VTSAAEIARALGGRRTGGGYIARCPAHSEHTPSLSITDGPAGRILVHCFGGCSQVAVIDALYLRGLWQKSTSTRPEPTERENEAQRQCDREREAERVCRDAFVGRQCERIWHKAQPDTPELRSWLEVRGIDRNAVGLDRMDNVLRWHRACPLGRDAMAPAMVALMTDARTNKPTGIHRTFLTPDGSSKAPIPSPRMMLGKAGIIRLSLDEDVELGLGICEGIETGLSIMARGWRPIWACGSLGTLRTFPVLGGIECLTIFGDPKPHEIEGACECARRWIAAGKEAHVRWSGEPGLDFNDLDLRGAT
jgi:hypothetical protein